MSNQLPIIAWSRNTLMETNLIQSDRTIKTWDLRDHRKISSKNISVFRDGCRTAATSKIERSVIIVNGWKPNYYQKALHLGSCSSPRSTSGFVLSFGCLTSHNLALFEISYLPRLLEATSVCNTYHVLLLWHRPGVNFSFQKVQSWFDKLR